MKKVLLGLGTILVGCGEVTPNSRSGDGAASLVEAAGLRTGVVAVAHAFNCDLDGWIITRLNELHKGSTVPVKVLLITHDTVAAREAANEMALAMPFAPLDQEFYREISSRLGVRAPFLVLLKSGFPQMILGNMEPGLAFTSLKSHLDNLGYGEREES